MTKGTFVRAIPALLIFLIILTAFFLPVSSQIMPGPSHEYVYPLGPPTYAYGFTKSGTYLDLHKDDDFCFVSTATQYGMTTHADEPHRVGTFSLVHGILLYGDVAELKRSDDSRAAIQSSKIGELGEKITLTYIPSSYRMLKGSYVSGTMASLKDVNGDLFVTRSEATAVTTVSTPYNPSSYALVGGTTLDDGYTWSASDVASNDGIYARFKSYYTGEPGAVYVNSPSDTYVVTSGWTDPANAYTSDDRRARSTTTDATQGYRGYALSIPATATITKVEVGVEGYCDTNDRIAVTISWDGGITWATESTIDLAKTEAFYWVDFTAATAWTPDKLSDVNLRTRVRHVQLGGLDAVNLDWLPVRVTTAIDRYTCEVEFTGSSDTYAWTRLDVTVDLAWTVGSVSTTIQVYDYSTGTYPTSGDGYLSYTSGAADADETKTLAITTDPTRFRDAVGNWKVKVKGVKETSVQFVLKADWIEFKTTYQKVTEHTVDTQLEFGEVSTEVPSELVFTFVSQYTADSVSVTIGIWNYETGAWDDIVSYISGPAGTEETKTIKVTERPARYVSAGSAKVHVKGVKSTDTAFEQRTNQVKLDFSYVVTKVQFKAEWVAVIAPIDPNVRTTLMQISVHVETLYDIPVTQSIHLWDYSLGAWSPSVDTHSFAAGLEETRIVSITKGTQNYISPEGEVKIRIVGSLSNDQYTCHADIVEVRLTYSKPNWVLQYSIDFQRKTVFEFNDLRVFLASHWKGVPWEAEMRIYRYATPSGWEVISRAWIPLGFERTQVEMRFVWFTPRPSDYIRDDGLMRLEVYASLDDSWTGFEHWIDYVIIRLAIGYRLFVQVVDSEGRPVQGAIVNVVGVEAGLTNATGWVGFSGLVVKGYDIDVIWQGSVVARVHSLPITSDRTANIRSLISPLTMSFTAADGRLLYKSPSSFRVRAPNGTISPPLSIFTFRAQNGTWEVVEVIWQGSNVAPEIDKEYEHSGTAPSVASVKIRVYTLSFIPQTFEGLPLFETPSRYVVEAPNGTLCTLISPIIYQAQNGTWIIREIIVDGRNIAPYPGPTVSLNENYIWSVRSTMTTQYSTQYAKTMDVGMISILLAALAIILLAQFLPAPLIEKLRKSRSI